MSRVLDAHGAPLDEGSTVEFLSGSVKGEIATVFEYVDLEPDEGAMQGETTGTLVLRDEFDDEVQLPTYAAGADDVCPEVERVFSNSR